MPRPAFIKSGSERTRAVRRDAFFIFQLQIVSEGVSSVNEKELRRKQKGVSYAKWGYLFILPFFLAYFVFTFAPQVLTIDNSFFEN